jgi:hypothetical protein
MKTIIKRIILSIVIVGFVSLLTNCSKDTNCIAVITVRKQSDTSLVVPNAKVVIASVTNVIHVQGVTDINGQFRYTFSLPAILNVSASFPGTPDTLTGTGVIQLIVGGTAYKEIYVAP